MAIAIRLALIPLLLSEQLDPKRDHWAFGYEAGRLARSLAEGRGFADPLFAHTGPSAWMTPVYPAILASIFKVFGVYSTRSAIAALTFNALVSALTCIPVAHIARDCLGDAYAKPAAWLWALFPYAIYFPMERLWETWLATLLLAVAFWAVVKRDAEFSYPFWVGYALLWILGALTSPTLCVLMPVLAAYACVRLKKEHRPWVGRAGVFSCIFLVGISPWMIRNYLVFDHLVPMRDSFGLSLRLGTPGAHAYHWAQYDLGPWHNQTEWAEFQRLGEFGYMQREQALAVAAIRADPKYFIVASVRRAIFIWTGFWSFNRAYLAEEPMDLPNIPMCTLFTAFTLVGLRRLYKCDRILALMYAACLALFPLVFYTTSPEQYYRRPLDSIMVVLTANAFPLRRKQPAFTPAAAESPMRPAER